MRVRTYNYYGIWIGKLRLRYIIIFRMRTDWGRFKILLFFVKLSFSNLEETVHNLCQAVIRHSSGSHHLQFSCSCQCCLAVLRQLWSSSCKAVFRKSSGSCQTVVRQSSGQPSSSGEQFSNNYQAMIWDLSGSL